MTATHEQIDWQTEPAYSSITVQVGEGGRAYRATWELRSCAAPLVAVQKQSGEEWISCYVYDRRDRGAAAALNAAAAKLIAAHGLPFDDLVPETIFDA